MIKHARRTQRFPTGTTGWYEQDRADIVIVGNGIAGLTAAVEARRLAPHLQIAIITEQNHPTINTPALKQFAVGKLAREQLLAYPVGTERNQYIRVIHGRVEEIDAQSQVIYLDGESGFSYGSLLIATGSVARGLPAHIPGQDFDGVLALHRLRDYVDLSRRGKEVDEAVVIGSGPHAIETVTSLLELGIRVHLLVRGKTVLSQVLDQPASEMALRHLQEAGATIYTETNVVGILGRVGSVAGVMTDRHQMIPCQLVLSCTGTMPVTTLADHCTIPIQHHRGILVDNQLRTSVPNIYAAGDVAALKDPQTGNHQTRAQWHAAVLQGRMAAAVMTGQDESTLQPFGVPWHATQLGKLALLTVGNPLHWTEHITTLTHCGRGCYRRMTVIDDRLVGYLSLGPTQPDALAIKRLIDEGCSIRDVKDALLKGVFDARTYFSWHHFYVMQDMVAAERLLEARSRTDRALQARSLPTLSSPLAALPRQTDPLTPTPVRSDLSKIRQAEPERAFAATTGERVALPQGKLGSRLLSGQLPALPETKVESRFTTPSPPRQGLLSRSRESSRQEQWPVLRT